MNNPPQQDETNIESLKQQDESEHQTMTSGITASNTRTISSSDEAGKSTTKTPSMFQNNNKNNLNSSIKLPFPWKVHEMLETVETKGQSHIVSWLPHGKSFRVHRQKEFVDIIMPSYFNCQSKFTSFTRQLYIYGFQKVQDGPDKGAFFQKQFVRGDKSVCLSMKRKRDKPLPKSKQPKKDTSIASHNNDASITGLISTNQASTSVVAGQHHSLPELLMQAAAATSSESLLLQQTMRRFSLSGMNATATMGLQDSGSIDAAVSGMNPPFQYRSSEAMYGGSMVSPPASIRPPSTAPLPHPPRTHHQPNQNHPLNPMMTSQLAAQMRGIQQQQQQLHPKDEEDWLTKYERLAGVKTEQHQRMSAATTSHNTTSDNGGHQSIMPLNNMTTSSYLGNIFEARDRDAFGTISEQAAHAQHQQHPSQPLHLSVKQIEQKQQQQQQQLLMLQQQLNHSIAQQQMQQQQQQQHVVLQHQLNNNSLLRPATAQSPSYTRPTSNRNMLVDHSQQATLSNMKDMRISANWMSQQQQQLDDVTPVVPQGSLLHQQMQQQQHLAGGRSMNELLKPTTTAPTATNKSLIQHLTASSSDTIESQSIMKIQGATTSKLPSPVLQNTAASIPSSHHPQDIEQRHNPNNAAGGGGELPSDETVGTIQDTDISDDEDTTPTKTVPP